MTNFEERDRGQAPRRTGPEGRRPARDGVLPWENTDGSRRAENVPGEEVETSGSDRQEGEASDLEPREP